MVPSSSAGTPRLLVVEDDSTSRRITVRLLRRVFDSVEVAEVGSIASAKEAVHENEYDCVLLDYHLDDGTALNLLESLRQLGSAAPSVVVLSGDALPMMRRRAIAAGAHDYLIKGEVNPKTLRTAIEAAVESSNARRDAERVEYNSRELLNSLPLQVYVVDSRGKITYSNQTSATDRAGRGAGDEFMRLVDIESHASCQEALFSVIGEGGRRLVEVRIRGRRHLCQVAQPAGQEGRAVVAALDVEERRRAEGALRILSAAVEHTSDALLITDRSGEIEYVNPAFESLTGYSRAEAVGRKPSILKSGRHDPDLYAQLWQTVLAGQTYSGTLWNKRKGGELYQQELSVSPIVAEDGVIRHFVATGRDISARLLLEEQLRQAQKMDAVGRLAGGIAHDFNNILTTIITYTDFVRQSLPAADPRQRIWSAFARPRTAPRG
jgi:PAS domain S-box-containing protein